MDFDESDRGEDRLPRSLAELREVLVRRGYRFDAVILPGEQNVFNPAGNYSIRRVASGGFLVTVHDERGQERYRQIFTSEASVIDEISGRLSPLRRGTTVQVESDEERRLRQEAQIEEIHESRRKYLGDGGQR